MNNKKILLLVVFSVFLLTNSDIFSQVKGNLRGFVADSSNGEVLAYSTIKIKGEKKGLLQTREDTFSFHLFQPENRPLLSLMSAIKRRQYT